MGCGPLAAGSSLRLRAAWNTALRGWCQATTLEARDMLRRPRAYFSASFPSVSHSRLKRATVSEPDL